MPPYKTLIPIDRSTGTPLYQQITSGFIRSISAGVLGPGLKLPGTRKLAEMLSVHRRTVIAAYEEMESQGWIEVRSSRGCFVNGHLPVVDVHEGAAKAHKDAHFALYGKYENLSDETPYSKGIATQRIDDGYPDVTLAPRKALAKNFSFVMNSGMGVSLMNYTQSYRGDIALRQALCTYLRETRGIAANLDNILITRGSLMAFYLLFQALLKPGDRVIVGVPGFDEGYNTIRVAGGELVPVPVDEEGMDIDAVHAICKSKTIRAVYIIPHHHYPTTVSLSASRRMQLLALAERYNFAIIEDDYDYDFHYASSPILPIASADYAGVVAYVGSLSKIVAPSLRIGFLVAPTNLVDEVSTLSQYLDSFGNTALERAVAMLFEQGEISRHLRKALQVYRERRDHFCQLLQKEMGSIVTFDVPEGGLATWIKFNAKKPVTAIITSAAAAGLQMPGSHFANVENAPINAIRMGFASKKSEDVARVIDILKGCIH
ncbi:MAG: PLP-dependent aminotransferase family protein [Bacteroidota bacterium]